MGRLIQAAGVARMKSLAWLLCIASACTVASSPAAAFHFIPINTAFQASGTVGFVQGTVAYVCTLDAKGKTGALGKVKITDVKLTGSDNCSATKAIHLPWKIKATGPSGAKIRKLGFTGPIGECGPGPGAIQAIDGAGNWSFDLVLPPTCIVSGSLATSPAMTITN